MQYAPERVDLEYFRAFHQTRPQDRPVGINLGSVLGSICHITSVAGMS